MPGKVALQIDPTPRHARHSEGAFVTLASGRILFIYTRYKRGREDAAAAVLASRYSDDQGRTWSAKDQVVVEQEGNRNVMSVSLLRLQDGRIALFYLRKDDIEVDAGALTCRMLTCMPFVRFSEDEGASWSDPLQMNPSPGYYILNNDRVIQLESGRLVAPLAMHPPRGTWEIKRGKRTPKPWFGSAGLIFYLVSDDGGITWSDSWDRLFVQMPQARGLQEPGVIELKDGRLWSWCRTEEGNLVKDGVVSRQWQSFSADQGLTWTPAEPSVFYSPCSPLSMKRAPSGQLLAVWNNHDDSHRPKRVYPSSWGRTPLTSAVSDDEGVTWRDAKTLESSPRGGYCYTAIHFTEDGGVLLAYCAGGVREPSEMVLDTLRIRRVTGKGLGLD